MNWEKICQPLEGGDDGKPGEDTKRSNSRTVNGCIKNSTVCDRKGESREQVSGKLSWAGMMENIRLWKIILNQTQECFWI